MMNLNFSYVSWTLNPCVTNRIHLLTLYFDIRAARKYRRQLERKWRDNGKREVHLQEYCKQHDIVKNMINQAKIAHYSSLVEESSGNHKKLFNIVEKPFYKPKTPVLPSTHSDQDLANAFSNFFVTNILKIRWLSVFEPTCVTEIKELIMKSPSKSCELDPVPTSLIKQNIDIFAKYHNYCKQISFLWLFSWQPEDCSC